MLILLLISVLANPRAPDVAHSTSLKKDTVVGISFIAVAASCGLILFIFVLVYIRYQKRDLLKYRNELFPKYSGEPQVRLRVTSASPAATSAAAASATASFFQSYHKFSSLNLLLRCSKVVALDLTLRMSQHKRSS